MIDPCGTPHEITWREMNLFQNERIGNDKLVNFRTIFSQVL